MRVTWFHLFAVLSAQALEDGDEAIEAEQAAQFDAQAQEQHGVSYAELKDLVDEAVREAKAALGEGATEAQVRAAIDAAAASVFAAFPTPPSRTLAPDVADEGDESIGGDA